MLARPSAGIGVVKVQKPMFFFAISAVLARPSAGIGVVEVQKPMAFFAISAVLARPSAGIGVVEVQKPMVFCDFCGARATLCGDRRGRGANTHGFLRFLKFPRDPLRGSAWSRCKNPWFFAISDMLARPSAGIGVVEVQKPMVFFAISAVLARPSAGIGVVEVQKPMVFCDFCGARATLCGDRRGRGANTRGFLRFLLFELVLGSCLVVRAPAPGTGGSRVRFLPGPRAGVARCNLHFKATCADQLAQSKLHRATCADQLAPTSLRRAPCLEQLAQSNLRRATYAEQLAQSNLHRAPCLVLSRACFTNASCREKERILQRWADLACDVLLSGQPWSSWRVGSLPLVCGASFEHRLGGPGCCANFVLAAARRKHLSAGPAKPAKRSYPEILRADIAKRSYQEILRRDPVKILQVLL